MEVAAVAARVDLRLQPERFRRVVLRARDEQGDRLVLAVGGRPGVEGAQEAVTSRRAPKRDRFLEVRVSLRPQCFDRLHRRRADGRIEAKEDAKRNGEEEGDGG